jgi:hypothetical protein
MRALLTVTHHDADRESYILECPHGSTTGQAEKASPEARERLIAGLMARHGGPFGCACAAETDLVDAYPSADSAIEQIAAGPSRGLAELDDETKAGLIGGIEKARCATCSIGILVMPLHLPLVAVPLHDVRCPNARWGIAAIENDDGPIEG